MENRVRKQTGSMNLHLRRNVSREFETRISVYLGLIQPDLYD